NIANVNDDATIPAVPVKNWTRWNNFRTGAQREGLASWQADLYVVDHATCASGCSDDNATGAIEVQVRVANRGLLDASDVAVTFHAGHVEAAIVASTALASVPSGEVVVASVVIDRATWGGGALWVAVATGDLTPECDEDNNLGY